MASVNCWVLVCVLSIFSSHAFSGSVIKVDPSQRYNLSKNVEYLLDSSLELSIEDVRHSQSWQAISSSTINFGYIKSALWLHFTIQPVANNEYILHLPYPLLDYLDNYSFIDNQALSPILTGDARDFNSRIYDHIEFVFPYTLNTKQTLSVYLRVQSDGSVDVPLKLLSKNLFIKDNEGPVFFRGFVTGILWLMLFYNLFIFVAIRDKLYGYYVLHIFACIITYMAYDGVGFQYIWPHFPTLNSYMFPIFNGLIQGTGIIFMLELLQVLKQKSWQKNYFIALLIIVSPFPILGAILPYSFIVPIEVLFSLLVVISTLLFGAYLSLKGDRTAMYYTLAVSLFMVGLACTNLRSFNILPTNPFTQHAFQFGFFIEMVVLSLALTQKISASNRQCMQAQKENIKNLKRYEGLYSQSVSGNFQVKKNGELMSVNPAFSHIIGFNTPEDLMKSSHSHNIANSAINKNAPMEFIDIVKHNGSVVGIEEEILNKDGKHLWVSISMRPIKNISGETEYYEGSMIDISERKENETLREQALKDRMKTLEQLVIGICHEVNTPLGTSLTGISHIKDLVREINQSFTQQKLTRKLFENLISDTDESLSFTEESLIRVRELIRQFKHVSVNQIGYELETDYLYLTLKHGPTSLQKCIDAREVDINIECDKNLRITSYNKAISQVIRQLVSNSLDHAFHQTSNNKICIKATRHENMVEIIYSDNGSGLSEQGRKELFNPFYTTMRGMQGKMGLGMYITYNTITQLLNGNIKVESSDSGILLSMHFPVQFELTEKQS